ncbi:hypothetical protein R6Q57_020262 [Mikania cordata]
MTSSDYEQPKKLQLYSYHRSSCSFRVRIALNLKGLDYEYKAVNLLKGEQKSPEFLKLNPIGYVPALVDGDIVIADSFAIIMYLEEKYPQHPLLPGDIEKRAINYQAANIVCASIQPLQNLDVLVSKNFYFCHRDHFHSLRIVYLTNLQNYIEEKVGPDAKVLWVEKHISKGFAALEKFLKNHAGRYATGDDIFLADLFLAPQIHGSIKRFNLDMTPYPLLARLHEEYMQLPVIQDALPEKQPDFPST